MDVHLKSLFGRFHNQFRSGPRLGPASGTCLLKLEGVLLPSSRHCAALYRTDPWKTLNPKFEELRFAYGAMIGLTLMMCFEPFIETVDVQWPSAIAKSNDIVAVIISHPPGQVYEEKTISLASSSPTKYTEPAREDNFSDIKGFSNGIMRQRAMCEKEFHSDQSFPCNKFRAIVYCGLNCQKQHRKESHKSISGL